MTHAGEVEASFAAATAQLGSPDALVHAVGSTLLKPAHITSDAELEAILAVNLRSAFYALRSFVKLAPRDGGGSVVFFSSAATRVGLANHEAIAAAKGGIDGLVVSAAATYAPRGIRINAIAPGLVRTNLTRRITDSEPALRASLAMHALGRAGEADEIASAAAYLVSPEASWITGQVISIDGGLSTVRPPVRI
jgi:NAD(P)-dependent dehydrogenase (short-subunit alcohol dehydrogenase family)